MERGKETTGRKPSAVEWRGMEVGWREEKRRRVRTDDLQRSKGKDVWQFEKDNEWLFQSDAECSQGTGRLGAYRLLEEARKQGHMAVREGWRVAVLECSNMLVILR